MNEESVLKILSRLAEGKLTARQAQEMLLQPRPGGRAAEFISTVESAVNSAVESATEAVRNTGVAWGELRQEGKGRRIVVRASGMCPGGSASRRTDVVLQNLGWPARLIEDDEEITLDVVGARATLLVPGDCPLNITISGCKVNLIGLDVPVAIYGVGCDIQYDAPGSIQLDAHLDAGNLEVRLPANADPRVHVDCMMDECRFPMAGRQSGTTERGYGVPLRRETKAYVDVRITAGKMTVTVEPAATVTIPIEIEETPAPAVVEKPAAIQEVVPAPTIQEVAPAPVEAPPEMETPVTTAEIEIPAAVEEIAPTPVPVKARKKKGKVQKSRA